MRAVASTPPTAARVAGSTITDNTANGGKGGGVYVDGDGFTLDTSTVSGNLADIGAGLDLYDVASVTNSTVTGNTATSDGGGIFSDDGNQLANDTISKNSANLGGGIYDEWVMDISSTAIVANTTTGTGNAGGGIYVKATTDAAANLAFSTVASNSSSLGGGIYKDGGAGLVEASTIAGNTVGGAELNCAFGTSVSPAHLPRGERGR